MNPRARNIGMLVYLAAGLSVCIFILTAARAHLEVENTRTFIEGPSSWDNYLKLEEGWRTRVLSNYGARLAGQLNDAWPVPEMSHLQGTIGTYCAVWLLLVNLLFIATFGTNSLVFIWGIFAAVVFGYLPGIDSRVFPWDLSALFVYSAFVVCWHRRLYWAIVPVVLLGLGFKETSGVLIFSFLFTEQPRKTRLAYFGGTLLAFIVLKYGIQELVALPEWSSALPTHDGPTMRLFRNFHYIVKSNFLNSPIWVNAGSALILFVLPAKDQTGRMIKALALAFTAGIFILGNVYEFRVWFELAPLTVYSLGRHFQILGKPS